jgi:hypothetical protein
VRSHTQPAVERMVLLAWRSIPVPDADTHLHLAAGKLWRLNAKRNAAAPRQAFSPVLAEVWAPGGAGEIRTHDSRIGSPGLLR